MIYLRNHNSQLKQLKIVHQTKSDYKVGQIISLSSYIRLLRDGKKVILLDFEKCMHELMIMKLRNYYEQLQEKDCISS